jgi:CDP-diacylglycerol--glycerol-3-phosphate 3-phosphatidyltransferase
MIVPKLYGFAKFGRLTSYHTRGAVLAAYLVGGATVLMFAHLAIWPFRIAAILVIVPKLEEMAITTVLPRQVTMVPSLRRAIALRRELLARPHAGRPVES